MGVLNHLRVIPTACLGFGLCVSSIFAHPAPPNQLKTVKNADGSEVTVQSFGDEHYHYTTTEDGYLVVGDGNGSYVYADEDGKASKIKARNAHKRSESDKKFLKKLDKQDVKKRHRAVHVDKYPEENTEGDSLGPVALRKTPAVLNRPTPEKWATGERWIPVLLIGTTDKPYADSAEVYNMLNQEGYSKDGNIGSLRDYYLYSSGGKLSLHFDVYPLQLGVALTSFGSGSSYSEGNFTKAGVEALTARADFMSNAAKYCFSGTSVDGFVFLFPGKEVDALKQSSDFWGHMYWMKYNGAGSTWNKGYKSNGYTFDKYLFIAQYDDNPAQRTLNAMGIFAHEFSHVLGLADLYSVNNSSIKGPAPYDVMTIGMYNGNWNTPPAYSAFERESMGWMELIEVKADSTYSLSALSDMQAYSITNPNHNDEYYVVEYRPAVKYDAYIGKASGGKNGVLVWYIDYDKSAFEVDNDPNGNANHQRVTVKKTLSAGEYYANFTYTNLGGVSNVPGIYSVVNDGDKRACFTTSQSMNISKCPEEEVLSSSSEMVPESSSSEKLVIGKSTGMSSLRMNVSAGMLNIVSPSAGAKTVKLFDMQGNAVLVSHFEGSATSIDLRNNLSGGSYVVRISQGKQVLGIQQIHLP